MVWNLFIRKLKKGQIVRIDKEYFKVTTIPNSNGRMTWERYILKKMKGGLK